MEPPVTRFQEINTFLLSNDLTIKTNPAISPDMTLDFPALVNEIASEAEDIVMAMEYGAVGNGVLEPDNCIVWPKSSFSIGNALLFIVESKRSGDCALVSLSDNISVFDGIKVLEGRLSVIPLWWENVIRLKNEVLKHDPGSTIFPRVDASLKKTSLGIGARFTTLHWPAVAWTMKALELPLTANQNSIPRELVYDVNAMLEGRLQSVSFPFIGSSVPEGHQGQSVMGMSHASIITLLKYGFHHNNIPWGFNADHQPIGGRYDEIEEELVEGSLFASYITYDLSPELILHTMIDDPEELDTVFNQVVDPAVFSAVTKRLSESGFDIPAAYCKKMVTYLMPAMKKMVKRDLLYTEVRAEKFSVETGRHFIREISIDELPGETTPELFAVCLALTEALGVKFDFVAPNFGFQKNIPYEDNNALQEKIRLFSTYAGLFDVSIGFHSGSGKSAENYRCIGTETNRRFEVKTSGRYTYEMGVALAASTDLYDQSLWADWYSFAKELAVTSAFSSKETQRTFAREFISAAFEAERLSTDGIYNSTDDLRRALDSLPMSPEHAFWFEYNFLFVLAADGSINQLGDHSAKGYRQRARFYGISDAGQLLYAKRVASYLIFLAESTGIANDASVEQARRKLEAFKEYRDLLDDI